MRSLKAEYRNITVELRKRYVNKLENVYICNINNCGIVLSINKKPTRVIKHIYLYHKELLESIKKEFNI